MFIQQNRHVDLINAESSMHIGDWEEINDVEMKKLLEVLIFIGIYKSK